MNTFIGNMVADVFFIDLCICFKKLEVKICFEKKISKLNLLTMNKSKLRTML